ncbi:MAG: hypothetical protein RLZZ187_1544 [Pseudomonadota bacterium]
MRRYLLAATASLAICGGSATSSAQTAVDAEMVLVFDSSGSIVSNDVTRAIAAQARLFNDPRLVPFLRQQGINSLAISAFSFGSRSDAAGTRGAMLQFAPWQVIETTAQARAFSTALSNPTALATAAIGGLSPLGPAIWRAGAGLSREPDPTSGYAVGTFDFKVGTTTNNATGLLDNPFTGRRLIINVMTDGIELPPAVNAGLPALEASDNTMGVISLSVTNINAIAIASTAGAVNSIVLREITLWGRTASGEEGFWLNASGLLDNPDAMFELACQKFGRELVTTTPAAGASCEALLGRLRVIPRTERRANERERLVGRRPLVTDVAVPPGRERSLTASAFLGSSVTDTVASETTLPNGQIEITIDRLTTEYWQDDYDVVLVVPLRMPLEYGALTRLGTALFGEMLENQPQRAQRLRGQVAPRGPAAVRGDGAPSTADQAQGGVFAAAGLNDSLRYTASGQFAALPGFDFGWGEGQAGLDPAFTGTTGVWGRPFYSRARMDGGRGVNGYDHSHRGFAMGADVRIGRYGLVGVWGGGSSANVGFSGPGGGAPSSGSMSSWVGGVYGSAATGSLERGLWYADVTLGYGEQDWTLNRVTLAGAPARGEFRSPAFGAYTEAGYAGYWGQSLIWQPHLFLRTVQTERPGLAETGTDEGVARQVDSARFTSVKAGPGLRLSQTVSLGDGLSLVPEGRIRWEREFGDNAASVSGAFVFDGARVPFAGRAPGLDRDALGLGASLKLVRPGGVAGGGLGLDLDWDASVSNDTTAHRFALQLRYAW